MPSSRVAQLGAQFGANSAGPTVGEHAVIVHGAEVAASGHVSGQQLGANAEGFQRATADQVLQRVVSEQRQVAGPTARSNADLHRSGESAGAALGQSVQIGDVRGLQLRLAGVGMG